MQAKLSRLGPGYEKLNVSWELGEVSGGGGDLDGDTYLHPGTRYGDPGVERLDVAQLGFVGYGWAVRY